MKTGSSFLPLLLVAILQIARADAMSIEEFKKMDPGERTKAIAEAPPGQKEEFIKVERHLQLLHEYGSEAGVKAKRESTSAMNRGVFDLEVLFDTQSHLWELYLITLEGGARDKSGVISREDEQRILAAQKKLQSLEDRRPIVHSLVYNLAASAEALDLAKRAVDLNLKWHEETNTVGSDKLPPSVSTELLAKVDEEAARIFAQLKKLPRLNAAEAQKEYEAATEDKILR